jgi:hypothetical protein
VQLWSVGLYLQAMIEGLVGLRPLAHRHQLAISPCLPANWPQVRLSGVRIGEHLATLRVTPASLEVLHVEGSVDLQLLYRLPPSAELLAPAAGPGQTPEEVVDEEGRWVRVALAAGQRALIEATPQGITVQAPERRAEYAGNGAKVERDQAVRR